MPFGMSNESRERIESNNEVKLNGTYEFEIVDVWFHNVIEETKVSKRTGKEYNARSYTAEPSNDQDVQFKLRLVKRPDIVVSDTLRVYVGKKSRFAQLVASLIQVEPGDELIAYLLPDGGQAPGEPLTADQAKTISKRLREDLISAHVLCTMDYNEDTGYTRVKAYTQTPQDAGDGLDAIPLQTNPQLQKEPLTAAQRASESNDSLFVDELEDEIPF